MLFAHVQTFNFVDGMLVSLLVLLLLGLHSCEVEQKQHYSGILASIEAHIKIIGIGCPEREERLNQIDR